MRQMPFSQRGAITGNEPAFTKPVLRKSEMADYDKVSYTQEFIFRIGCKHFSHLANLRLAGNIDAHPAIYLHLAGRYLRVSELAQMTRCIIIKYING
jgi:hypothetical protein